MMRWMDALTVGITRRRVNWVLDADIRSFFDTVSQGWLIRFVEHRIGDGRIIRLIRKWLRAGVLERLEELALSLHPDKTRLIAFGRHAAAERGRHGQGKPETFDFLGFTFVCGKTRAGKFLVKRKSRRDRMRAKLGEVKEELRRRRHQPIPEQGQWLRQVVSGFFNYHAVPTNIRSLSAFRHHVTDLWRRSLRRRSQKDRTTWERMAKIAKDFLPKPRILHPWPSQRFAVRHPRWEPYAGMPLVRFCAGGAQQ